MANKRVYTESDKARVFTQLTVNEGNVKRTSEDLGVPQQTVRDWKKQWERGGVPAQVKSEVPAVAGEVVEKFEGVRDMALDKIRELIPESTVRQIPALATLVGILSDKIDRAKGLDTRKLEVEHTIAAPEQVAEALLGLVTGAVDAATERQQIIDAEVVEQAPRALPAAVN